MFIHTGLALQLKLVDQLVYKLVDQLRVPHWHGYCCSRRPRVACLAHSGPMLTVYKSIDFLHPSKQPNPDRSVVVDLLVYGLLRHIAVTHCSQNRAMSN